MRQYYDCISILDIKTKIIYVGYKKILGEKETIQFPLIYVGHKNENWIKKETILFSLIHVGHKNENIGGKGLSLIYDGHKD